jgi:transcriptional regulator with XRE-family HTH domain
MHDGIPDDMRKFVMNIWTTRVSKGWSQAQLDERADLGYARTSTIERGLKLDGITRRTIRQLAQALEVSEQWLLYGTAETQAPKRLEELEGWFAIARRAQESSEVPLSDAMLRLIGKVAVPESVPLTPKLVQDLSRVLAEHSAQIDNKRPPR